MKTLLIPIGYLMTGAMGQADAEEDPGPVTAIEMVAKAHEALGNILQGQAGIRTAEDLESFKVVRGRNMDVMKQLAAAVPDATPPSDFVRNEIYGTAMRYRYELFPPTPDSDPYLAEVPERFHDELKRLGADQPPEIAPLWAYIAEVTTPKEEDGLEIVVGSQPIDRSLKAIVSLGRHEEKPDLAFDAATRQTSFVKGAEYIAVSVEADEPDGRTVLYAQEFPRPENLDEGRFKVSDVIRINPETRVLDIVIPGVEHSYQLPARRQHDAGGQPATRPGEQPATRPELQ